MASSRYAVVMVTTPWSGNWELMTSGGKIVVFDTPQLAWEWLPQLAQGRLYQLDRDRLTLTFLELSTSMPNRARVIANYDPEEAQPWKKHMIWSAWWYGQNEEAMQYGGNRVHL